jgi:Raf kinase inhibitor-like YbhB/YbcL family protein
MASASVELTSVRKTFGPTVALDDCSLSAYPGEVHAIVGGNGSGKSTLAKVMSGVLIPDSGQVSVMGRAPTSPVEARRVGIANVFQEVLVADGCSVLDNLYLGSDGLFTASMHREDKVEQASRFLRDLLGFDLDLTARVGDLPLSIKQWITIARGMLSDPNVLILDESSAALDFESTERLFAKMRELKARGTAILIVTHRIADRATVLRDGSDVGCLERDEITEHSILELIAGPQSSYADVIAPIPEPQGERPVLRIEDARIWPDAEKINFTLYPGEVVGVTGLDGQGQADFVKAIAGVTRLVSGRISVIEGRTAHEVEDLRSARANRVSYISGDRKKEGIFPNLSIYENLAMPVYREYRAGGFLNITNRTKLVPVFEWETDKLRVKMGSRHNLITSLSGGNQQKVLIARSFAESPAVLVLNDPARGIDVGAKHDLYRNLQNFAASGRAAIFLSSEIEEFMHLCSRVQVFRNGAISSEFRPPYDTNVILNATFGRRLTAAAADAGGADTSPGEQPAPIRFDEGRPMPRSVGPVAAPRAVDGTNDGDETMATRGSEFTLSCPDIEPGQVIPDRFVEDNINSPHLNWSGVPDGTRGFALAITDPDLPEEFGFPRSFAHWLVHDIPANVRDLPEGASQTGAMPAGARELNPDFVTFQIPGFGRGYGGPWPPDRQHRYFFTLYALAQEHIELGADADLTDFYAAVMPVAIDSASFVAVYGPARKPLPA